MRRILLFVLLVALALSASAPRAQTGRGGAPPQQADGIVRLIADVESALAAGSMEKFRPLTTAAMPVDAQLVFQSTVATGGVSQAALRERSRRTLEDGERVEVLAEMFISHGRNGRLATWILTVRPRAGTPDRYELVDLTEPSAFDSLIKLSLDTERQFTLHNFTLNAPDMVLKMPSGTAFVAEDEGGITALVLRGRGSVRFTPKDPAEQGQIEAFSGRPAFESEIDTAFVRIDSSEFETRISEHALVPAAAVDPRELVRARATFDDLSRKTYNVDLHDLTPDDWSFSPSFGSVVIEFKTPKSWLTYARSPGEAEDVTLFERARSRNISSYTSEERAATRGPDYSEDDLVSYDIENYALEVTFDPKNSIISGHAKLTLRIDAAAASIVTLRLAESLTTTAVSSPEFGRLLSMRVVGQNSLIVSLPATLMKDTILPLEISYNGRVSTQAVDRESPAGRTPIGPSAPDSPQAPVESLSIPPEPRFLYSNQVYWYPQSQVTDYATATMRLQVPAEYQVIANGSLVRPSVVTVSGSPAAPQSIRTSEYLVDRPARYLSVLITRLVEIGRMKVDVAGVAQSMVEGAGPAGARGVVNLEVVSTPRMANANRHLPERVAEMLKLYSDIVGEAPYPNFTVAGVEDNLPGGHSPAFFAIWLEPLSSTPFSWASDPLSLDSKYPQFFLAHEVAHQWWGQAVGWKNYHEQWLSEGLAQYFAAIFAGNDRGPDMLDAIVEQMHDSALAYTSRGPISLGYRLGHVQGDSRIFRAVTYNKGAVTLHMLRRLIGDHAFFAGLRRYYSGSRYAKAGTEELRAAMQAETPIRLNRFFQRWIKETGIPKLRVSSRVDDAARSAVIKVEQVGDVFDLPFTVTIQYMDGQTEAVTIPVTDAVTERPIPLKGPVRRILTRDDLTLAEYVK